ncbi:hypothetical protein P152DRAFT_454900 [Eremomyces bilateralis CBS 781.70]|uniref:Mediator of RNA polymerase II transcription subunit 4 n=1 Tax=Eremomyces bilateralis CBS 781.70 TaxID=1392243 RepID=A0A6G1GFP2_9PEZI|nr:uncharacterized protein P152DRAFT_454900 [Eremomyces bilateralis CBS 781.70]KAF1816670.1 hypothetical protein P152DRAFT_454900 [Eremomyces bilateralis CBS 781.70]
MDTILQTQFDRVETALNALIDSITTYNPQPSTATDLLAADSDLSSGLALLERHQHNHTYILTLRSQITHLEEHIQSTLRRVADTRKELLAAKPTPSTPSDEDAAKPRPVTVDELLFYARNISRFTVPPTQALSEPPPPAPVTETLPHGEQGQEMGAGMSALGADGRRTEDKGEVEATRRGMGVGWKSLTEDQRVWLDQMSRAPFMPWPNEESIKNGTLAAIRGVKPVWMEEGKVETEVLDSGVEENREETAVPAKAADVGTGGVSRPRETVPQQEPSLGFDLYDPDE